MIRRFLSPACTLTCLAALVAPAVAIAQPGVWQTEEQFLSQAGADWESVAPGVWQREKQDGHFVRLGFGIESFRWALDQARDRLNRLTAEAASSEGRAQTERQIEQTQEVIEFLDRSLRKARAEEAEGATLQPKASESGTVCDGFYELDVAFTCGPGSASTNSKAEWTEPSPLSPYHKMLHAYAEASSTDPETFQTETNSDEDSVGPIQGWAGQATASASTSLSLVTAELYGSAYVSISDGCSAYRFIEDSGDCR